MIQPYFNKFKPTNQFTSAAPRITSLDDTLYIAWTGTGQARSPNVAPVILDTSRIEPIISNINEKTTLAEFGDAAPALAAYNGSLYLAWKGYGNNEITILSPSEVFKDAPPNGPPKQPVNGNFADQPLSMAPYNGSLYIAWKGTSPTPFLQIAIVDPLKLAFGDQNPVIVTNPPENPPKTSQKTTLALLWFQTTQQAPVTYSLPSKIPPRRITGSPFHHVRSMEIG